jgi:hypothetical protein
MKLLLIKKKKKRFFFNQNAHIHVIVYLHDIMQNFLIAEILKIFFFWSLPSPGMTFELDSGV